MALEARLAGKCGYMTPGSPQGDPRPSGGPCGGPVPSPSCLLLFCQLQAPALLIPDLKFNRGRLENTDSLHHSHSPAPAPVFRLDKGKSPTFAPSLETRPSEPS